MLGYALGVLIVFVGGNNRDYPGGRWNDRLLRLVNPALYERTGEDCVLIEGPSLLQSSPKFISTFRL